MAERFDSLPGCLDHLRDKAEVATTQAALEADYVVEDRGEWGVRQKPRFYPALTSGVQNFVGAVAAINERFGDSESRQHMASSPSTSDDSEHAHVRLG
jgi:hypothetical protein